MSGKIYKGDIGTKIKINVGENIVTATIRKIKYKKPSGITGEWNALLEGTNYMYYITIANDINEKGIWLVQAYIELPDWKGHGETANFIVYDLFEG